MDPIALDISKFAALAGVTFGCVEVFATYFPSLNGRWKILLGALLGPAIACLAHLLQYFLDPTIPVWLGYGKAAFIGLCGMATAKAGNDLIYNPLKSMRSKGGE